MSGFIPTEETINAQEGKTITEQFKKKKYSGDVVESGEKKQKDVGYIGVDAGMMQFTKYLQAMDSLKVKPAGFEVEKLIPETDYHTQLMMGYLVKLNALIKATKDADKAVSYSARTYWKALQNTYSTTSLLEIASKLADSKVEAQEKAVSLALLSVLEKSDMGFDKDWMK